MIIPQYEISFKNSNYLGSTIIIYDSNRFHLHDQILLVKYTYFKLKSVMDSDRLD